MKVAGFGVGWLILLPIVPQLQVSARQIIGEGKIMSVGLLIDGTGTIPGILIL